MIKNNLLFNIDISCILELVFWHSALRLCLSLPQSILFVIIAKQNYNWIANGENANEKIAMENACTCLLPDPIESHVIGQPINS